MMSVSLLSCKQSVTFYYEDNQRELNAGFTTMR
jgi:hypothetical protein